ncbi:hypothetical protein [Phaeobacter sp. 22II1-1F12B]|uniref:hypothetical protein n=1 Tax=Phaeobacter sp. 22II1-1F12B TaxID=1317111 RepID=UPI000B528AF3|nr:hypothetical protein [Phaeobacter sp. 22II1-1F12B]OWU81972.1 hypothetical protein ATO1_03445 [Phaeobacter sp. 22II1-1F12B]
MASLVIYATQPGWAQDDSNAGFHATLGVTQGFTYGDNLGLGIPGNPNDPEEGTSSLATTGLRLDMSSITRTQRFNFSIGGSGRYGSPASGTSLSTGFVDPFMTVLYSREGANARFNFSAAIRETDVSDVIGAEFDDDGVLIPPTDLGDLTGTGTRRTYTASVGFETGLYSPFGLRFQADSFKVEYSDTTSNSLNDFERTSAQMTALFRIDPINTAVADFRYSLYNDDTGNPDEETRTVEFGFDRDLVSGGSIVARLGYTDTDDGLANTNDNGGTTGRLVYNDKLPNGGYSVGYIIRRTNNNEIDTLRVSRNLDLPLGSISGNIGLTSLGGASPEVVGGLNYNRDTQKGSYSFQVNRTVTSDSDDEDRFSTQLSARYRHDLTPYSSLVANILYYELDGTSTSNEVSRSSLELGYQHSLTEDWFLSTGVNLRVRDEENVGQGESQEIFLRLSRSFDLF